MAKKRHAGIRKRGEQHCDRHPGRPSTVEIIGEPLFPGRPSRYRSENSAEDYQPRAINWKPTDAPPGSFEKVQVLMERAAKHQPLWHPQDSMRYDGIFQHVLF